VVAYPLSPRKEHFVKGTVIIVGYGPGVGAGAAEAFAAQGHPVALVARNPEKLDEAVGRYKVKGWNAAGFPADVSDVAALKHALIAATGTLGPPDVLVYNAAKGGPGPVMALEAEHLMGDLRISVAGALVAVQAVVPGMIARRLGSVLFTGGGLALYPSPSAPSLAIGKSGIRTLALMLAKELAPQGIRAGTVTIATGVAPGGPGSPERIGAAFLSLHQTPPDPKTCEIVLRA
jgi:NAD(P)-dependent dehydrogenase (short-subunit alcohol dehydrogenase family)